MSILGSGNRDVEIYAPLNIKGNLTSVDKSVITGSTMATNTVGLTVQNGCSFGANVAITGNLTVSGFYSMKPYVGAYVLSSVVSTTVKPGYITPTLAKTTGQYIFTLPTAHPSGVNYQVFVQQRMGAQTNANALYGVLVNNSTSFTVWSKTTANVVVDSVCYVRAVP